MQEVDDGTELLAELERSLSVGSSQRRIEMLRHVTDVLLQPPAKLTPDQQAFFDRAIDWLADRTETALRRELAEKLAVASTAPMDVVRKLAQDEIEVARSILTRCARLSEADLVKIASESSQSHLLALSEREGLTESVCDVLVARGNGEVLLTVAGNETAEISSEGFRTMLMRGGNDERLQEIMASRPNLRAEHFQTLFQAASERVRERLIAQAKLDRDRDRVAAAILAAADEQVGRGRQFDFSRALSAAAARQEAGALGEAELVKFAADGHIEDVLAGLAILSRLSIETVEKLWLAQSIDGLILLIKSIGFSWESARDIMRARARVLAREPQTLQAEAKFRKLREETAASVTRFWRVRMAAVGAAE